jgi:hypothetical protein
MYLCNAFTCSVVIAITAEHVAADEYEEDDEADGVRDPHTI